MENTTRPVHLVWPVIFISVGVVLLLNNLGIITWGVWHSLIRLWPVLLIAIGLDLLFGRRSVLGGVVASVLILAVLGVALWLAINRKEPPALQSIRQVNHALQTAGQVDITISPTVCHLHVSSADRAEKVITGSITPIAEERISDDFRIENGTAYFSLHSRNLDRWAWSERSLKEPTWTLRLPIGVPTTLTLQSGVGVTEADLTGLRLTALHVSCGVGQTTLALPMGRSLAADISGGVGKTLVRIPASLPARIRIERGVGDIAVDSAYVRSGDSYQSPNYTTASPHLDLAIHAGVGAINIERLDAI